VGVVSVREFNRRELVSNGRWVALLVAVNAAVYLLLSYRGARVAAAECRVVRRPPDECVFEYQRDGKAEQSRRAACASGPWAERARSMKAPPGERWPVGITLPCFHYVNEPAAVFLEPRVHRWAKPAAVALLVGGLLGAALAHALTRLRRRPRPPEAPPGGPYRRGAEAEGPPPKPAPVAITLFEPGCLVWFLAIPALSPSLITFGLTLFHGWKTGGEVDPFYPVFMAAAHGASLLGAPLFFSKGLEIVPEEGLLVTVRRLGPLCFRRAYDLHELGEASHKSEQIRTPKAVNGMRTNHYLVISRPRAKAALRWDDEDEEAARRHAAVVNEVLAAWRRG
jgi:hypothetical protein